MLVGMQIGCQAAPRLAGLDTKQRAVFFGGQHIQQIVRPLPDIANALLQLGQHGLAAQFFPAIIEDDALNLPGARNAALPESCDKQIALPV